MIEGRLFILGFEGYDTESAREFCRNYNPAGWIIFKKNIYDREQLVQMIEELKAICSPFPVFIAVDQEGGRVNRLPEKFPPAREMAEIFSSSPEKFRETIGRMADLLRKCGFNLNLAPVLDVAIVESDVIGDRAFSSSPEVVKEIGKEWISIFSERQIFSCGKHFPGHGGVVADSHQMLPHDHVNYEKWKELYFPPFRENFQNLDFIMTTHVAFDFIDPVLPASLAPTTEKLLREEGFSGFIVSDDLYMKAVKDNFSPHDTVKLLLSNHTELWIISGDLIYYDEIYGALYDLKWKSEVRDFLIYQRKKLEKFWLKNYGRNHH